jgi:hypothetical protein
MIKQIVYFTENNARIIKDPAVIKKILADKQRAKNAVVNPNFSKVQAIPPHFWKRSNGRIVSMNDIEMAARRADHTKRGVINTIFPEPGEPEPAPPFPVEFYYAGGAMAAASLYVLYHFFGG